MTLTVRLKPDLESALEQHCAERGVSKSLLVQEALAAYLVQPTPRQKREAGGPAVEPGAAYLAFQQLGLIGGGESDGRSATKEVVRERIRQDFEQKRQRRS